MKSPFLPVLALLLGLTSASLAQEEQQLGRMWTFESPPLAYLEAEYGFTPDQAWLDALRLGSLRLGGEDVLTHFYSASFVSPKGLIMTSTRGVRDAIAESAVVDTIGKSAADRARSPLRNIKSGFAAAGPDQEVRLRSRRNEWLAAAQLIKITNVTDEVNKGVAPTGNAIHRKEMRDANKKAVLDVARKVDSKLVPQIVSLYQGAVYQLYQYKVYSDVRLVVLPHMQTALFGGGPDNFSYPRYSIDFAFLRAYENGKPAETSEHYFKWKSGGAKQDEPVFVSGNPGMTKRLSTMAQLEFERDIRLPMKVEFLTNRLRILTEKLTPLGPEDPSWKLDWVRMDGLELENGLKTARANLQDLQDAKLVAQKIAAERAFKDRVLADKNLAERYGDLWDRIDSVVRERRLHEAQARFHAPSHHLLHVVVAMVRSCDPDESDERREQARKTVESWARATSPVIHWPWSAFVHDQIGRARSWLPEDDPFFTKVLAGKSVDELTAALETDTPGWLGHPEQRDALVKAGWGAIQKSKDSVVIAARELVVLMRKNEQLGKELDAKEEALGAELGRALLACYGADVSSNGTTTLRFTDGLVKGFSSGDLVTPYRTTFDGLYARNAEFDNEYPFNLPKVWLDRKDKLDMTKTVNFASTNDITSGTMAFETSDVGTHHWRNYGGNAGSVVVNKALEVVGVAIDGNIELLHNEAVFNDDVARTVSVHVDGIMEALVKIFDADRIARELTGKQADQYQENAKLAAPGLEATMPTFVNS
jgi:hypothetical protein